MHGLCQNKWALIIRNGCRDTETEQKGLSGSKAGILRHYGRAISGVERDIVRVSFAQMSMLEPE